MHMMRQSVSHGRHGPHARGAARTLQRMRSLPTATCSSPSPMRSSDPQPTRRTFFRRPGCAGWTSTWTRCGTSVRTWSGSPPGRHSTRLRSLGRRKESYVGPWLPEPLLTSPDVAEDVELADSVSMAMLLVLETLAPTERAVFVLREVFDLGYDEIARSRRQESCRGPSDRPPGAGTRGRAPAARDRFPGRDPSCVRGVPTGGPDGRPAEPARRPRAGRRRLE